MLRSLSELSVAEIRRLLAEQERPLSPQLLRRLQRDPRRGVRQLSGSWGRRAQREKQQRKRLDALLNFERVLWRSGIERIAGVDEAGMGPLAGPVVAAAVVFAPDVAIDGIDDSKRLVPEQRERLALEIRACARGVGVGLAAVAEIDTLNVYQAGLLAMRRAVEALPEPPQHLLVDARRIPGFDLPQNQFQKGDGIDFSIAAASIIAKTHRDALMEQLDREYPGYGFARHKGYCTPEHQAAVRRLGPCPIHRQSYAFLSELCGGYSALFYRLQQQLEGLRGAAELAGFEAELKACDAQLAESELRKLRLTLGRRWKALGRRNYKDAS